MTGLDWDKRTPCEKLMVLVLVLLVLVVICGSIGYKVAEHAVVERCPAGQKLFFNENTSEWECKDSCPTGYTQQQTPEGVDYCQLGCSSGRNLIIGDNGDLSCASACPTGYSSDTVGNVKYCKVGCSTGHLSQDSQGNLTCLTNCNPGYSQALQGDVSYCKAGCPAGQRLHRDRLTGQLNCVASCPTGYTNQTSPSGVDYCKMGCPSGSVLHRDPTTNQLSCVTSCPQYYGPQLYRDFQLCRPSNQALWDNTV